MQRNKINLRGYRLALLGVAAAAFIAAGCDAQSAPEGVDSTPTHSAVAPDSTANYAQNLSAPGLSGTVTLANRVHSLDASMLSDLTLDNASVEVAAGAPAALQRHQPGDILIYTGEGGFWRYIEGIERRGETLVYKTRQAELNEVIRQGDIRVVMPPSYQNPAHGPLRAADGSTDRFQTREQGLDWGDVIGAAGDFLGGPHDATFTKSFETRLPLDSNTNFQFQDNTLALSTGGVIDFRPGFIFYIKIEDFNIQKVEFTTLGRLDTRAEVTLKLNENKPPGAVQNQVFYRDIPLCNSDQSNAIRCEDGKPTFGVSVLGQEIKIFPHLRAGFSWSGSGSGYVTTGLNATGHIKAGYAFNRQAANDKIFDHALDVSAITPEFDGTVNLDFRMSLELGMTASIGGQPVMTAYPFEGLFASNASTTAPACGISASLSASGRVLRRGFLGAGAWPLYNTQPLDITHPIDAPGCSVDSTHTAQTCSVAAPNCPKNHVCNQGYCVEDAPLQFSLNWSDASADLDLVVENPDGELLLPSASGDAQPASQGWMAVQSRAGTAGAESGPGTKFTEIALFRLPHEARTYRFWVRYSNAQAPQGNPPDVDYNVQILYKDRPANIMYSSIPARPGAESVRYNFYTAQDL